MEIVSGLWLEMLPNDLPEASWAIFGTVPRNTSKRPPGAFLEIVSGLWLEMRQNDLLEASWRPPGGLLERPSIKGKRAPNSFLATLSVIMQILCAGVVCALPWCGENADFMRRRGVCATLVR